MIAKRDRHSDRKADEHTDRDGDQDADACALPFDAAMISLAVEDEHPAHRVVRMLYAKFVTDIPAVGTLFSRLGGVQASTTNGATLLKRGAAVGIFPEGEEALGKPYHPA